MTPIEGISDDLRLPRVGKIHLGEKKESAKGAEYPSQLPYFLVRESETTPADAVAAFREVYGDEPTELRIVFPTDNPEDWNDQHWRCYSASWGLTCKGTGRQAEAKIDPKTNTWADKNSKTWEWQQLAKCGEACERAQDGRCKPVMRLSFLLPDVPGLGTWQIDSSSVHSMRNINGMVHLVQRIMSGRVAFFPFVLRRHQITVQPMNAKAKSVYVLDLRPDGLFTMSQARGLMEGKAALPAGVLPEADEEEVPEDLFPDNPEAVKPEEETEAEKSALATAGDLMNRCYEEFELTGSKVLAALGVSETSAIRSFDEAYEQIKAMVADGTIKAKASTGRPQTAPKTTEDKVREAQAKQSELPV